MRILGPGQDFPKEALILWVFPNTSCCVGSRQFGEANFMEGVIIPWQKAAITLVGP